MKQLNTLLAKLTLVLILGIILGFYIDFSPLFISGILVTLVVLLSFLFLKEKKSLTQSPFFGTLAFGCFLVLGIFTTTLHLTGNQPAHYSRVISSDGFEQRQVLHLTITEILKPDPYNEKFIAEVESINRKKVHGKLLVVHPKDSLKSALHPGKQLLLISDLKEIPKPLNPYQFDYNRFMALRGVQNQVNLRPTNFRIIDSEESDIYIWAFGVREKIKANLQRNRIEGEELAIIQALLLGQKQQISEEIYQHYADAGAVHILAVSGLHVGIIMLLLSWMLSPLSTTRKGKIIRAFLTICGLWTFALLSGLSPSVVRAVTMFSFISIGLELGRRTSTMNSVFLSLLLLLLIRPQWIFDVGFQLSYSAVIAILLIQPLLSKLWRPKNRILTYFWTLLTTTFAAQLGVLPLSLFYFHQFPGLFFLSNLVILPFLGLILGVGILVILLASLSLLPAALAQTYSAIIQTLNTFVEWVAQQEEFLFREVAFDFPETLAFYLLILTILIFCYSPGYKKLVSVLVAVVVLQLVYLQKISEEKDEIVIFHRSGRSVVGLQKGKKLAVLGKEFNLADQRMINNYKIGKRIVAQENCTLQNVLQLNEKTLLIIDSTGIFPKDFKTDFLLLSNSPKIHLAKAVSALQPKVIIADGNNYRFLVEHWRETAEKSGVTFHSTYEKGAFRIK